MLIVTNLDWWPTSVVRFCDKRGTAEQWVKEGKQAVRWPRLSCHDFQGNEVRLPLSAAAYHLANFLRGLGLPRPVKQWSLTTLRDKLIKIGAKVNSRARYVIFQLAEVAVPRELLERSLTRIRRLKAVRICPRPWRETIFELRRSRAEWRNRPEAAIRTLVYSSGWHNEIGEGLRDGKSRSGHLQWLSEGYIEMCPAGVEPVR